MGDPLVMSAMAEERKGASQFHGFAVPTLVDLYNILLLIYQNPTKHLPGKTGCGSGKIQGWNLKDFYITLTTYRVICFQVFVPPLLQERGSFMSDIKTINQREMEPVLEP